MNVNVVHVEMPYGATSQKQDVVNLQSYLNKKRCMLQIQNRDELCCTRAIIVAKAKLDKDPQFKSVVKHQRPLHETAGVLLGSCGIDEIKKLPTQRHL